jgi:tetratricopeptide (TPR) repeat protein
MKQTADDDKAQKIFWAVALSIITILAYLPAIQCGFIWDDDVYVTQNTLLTAPDGLWRIWFSTNQPSQYFPLVFTTFRLEYSIWGLNPSGYHLTNILLHAANAILLWILLRRLSIPGAWIASAIFALHPVQVESVAWITERKNVLMMLFFLLSLLTWVRFVEESETRRARQFYVLSLLFYALSLFSKTTACTMPAALILILWLKHIPLKAKRLFQVAPYLLLGLAMGILTVWWELNHQRTGQLELGLNPVNRILLASRALWFYISKLILPLHLCFSYPTWKIDENDPGQYLWFLGCLIMAWSIWRWRDSLGRKAVAAVIFFPAMLFPMLGFFSLYTFRFTYVADHYQYVASIGLIALAVGTGCRLAHQYGKAAKAVGTVATACILVMLGTLTWRQIHIYKDLETLWRDTLEKNPNSFLASNNLGCALLNEGNLYEAEALFRRTIKINPTYSPAYYNLGNLLQQQGKINEAISNYRQATEQQMPNPSDLHINWANALAKNREYEEAEAHLRRAIKIKPTYAPAYYNLGNLLQQQGKLNEAISNYRQALELRMPNPYDVHLNLAIALAQNREYEQALKHLNAALRINPDSPQVYYNWGRILQKQGKLDEAIEKWKKALELNPNLTPARQCLNLALKEQNKK